MNIFGGLELKLYTFMTSALVGCVWSASHLSCFTRMGGTCRQSVYYGEEKTLAPPGIDDQFFGCPALNLSI